MAVRSASSEAFEAIAFANQGHGCLEAAQGKFGGLVLIDELLEAAETRLRTAADKLAQARELLTLETT
jgi:hypothetical protein